MNDVSPVIVPYYYLERVSGLRHKVEPGGLPKLRRHCWEFSTMLLEFMVQSTKEEITTERKEERERGREDALWSSAGGPP